MQQELQTKTQDLSNQKQNITQLENDLQDKNDEMKELNSELEKRNTKIEVLKNQLASKQLAIQTDEEETEKIINDLKKNLENHQIELALLNL